MEKIGPFAYLRELPTQYSCGWLKPDVVQGYFLDNVKGNIQAIFFSELLQEGFTKTKWQLVFPGQTAGIVKKIPPPPETKKFTQCHVRFYTDGIITCEVEPSRFTFRHWTKRSISGIFILEETLNNLTSLSPDIKKEICALFGEKKWPLTKQK